MNKPLSKLPFDIGPFVHGRLQRVFCSYAYTNWPLQPSFKFICSRLARLVVFAFLCILPPFWLGICCHLGIDVYPLLGERGGAAYSLLYGEGRGTAYRGSGCTVWTPLRTQVCLLYNSAYTQAKTWYSNVKKVGEIQSGGSSSDTLCPKWVLKRKAQEWCYLSLSGCVILKSQGNHLNFYILSG